MILVTGASGLVGKAVLSELTALRAGPLRAIYRDQKDRAALPAAVEGVKADFSDAASLDAALKSVTAAYLVCAAIPQLVELETNFLLACQRAKTPHVVIQSALGAADFDKSFPSWHRKVEEKAKSVGIPCTILRPNGFMQNVATYFAGTIKSQDCFYDALGKARIAQIDVRDIAAVVAKALTSPQTIGQVFELNGPEPLSDEELAKRISKAAGRPIRYVELSLEQMLQGMVASGMPEARAKPVVELYEYYLAGKGEGSDKVLRDLLGRSPRTIDAYLAEIAPMFAK